MNIFLDSKIQNEYDTNGFVKLSLFSNEEVTNFKSFYKSLNLKDERKYGFHVSMDSYDDDLRKQNFDFIKENIYPRLERTFLPIQFFTGCFLIKEPYETGSVFPHQDWTFVDEKRYESVMCWLSLDHCTIENGAMGFIKGSHKFFNQQRGFPCPYAPSPIAKYQSELFPYLDIIETKPGDVLFFSTNTIHGSFPNMSKKTRAAISITITNAEADLGIWYLKPNTGKDVIMQNYVVSNTFFEKHNNPILAEMYHKGETIKDASLLEEIKIEPAQITWDQLKLKVENNGNVFNHSYAKTFANTIKAAAEANKTDGKYNANLFSFNKRKSILNFFKTLIS